MVDHPSCTTTEIIAFHHDSNSEAPRIYVKNLLLNTKIDLELLHSKVSAEKEPFIRKRKPYDSEAIEKRILREMVSKYLEARVIIAKDQFDSLYFQVELTSQSLEDIVDRRTNQLDIICSKPDKLTPYPASNKNKTT
jgi:hypothetical protein